MESRMPSRINMGRECDSVIEMIYLGFENGLPDSADPSASRTLCGYAIPDFQRPLVWTEQQKISFIESAWLGLPLGTFTVHDPDWESDGTPKRFSYWLIDGQQRLSAIEAYWNDEFPVFGYRWSQLNALEQRLFRRIKFRHTEIGLWDEAAIMKLYDLMAFGGTPHTNDQRAL